jgi:hypothetical protein
MMQNSWDSSDDDDMDNLANDIESKIDKNRGGNGKVGSVSLNSNGFLERNE